MYSLVGMLIILLGLVRNINCLRNPALSRTNGSLKRLLSRSRSNSNAFTAIDIDDIDQLNHFMKLSKGTAALSDGSLKERDWYTRFASAIAKDRTKAKRSTKKTLQYYQSFFEACRSSSIASFPLKAEEVLDESTEMLTHKNHGVCAYLLPPHLEKWPTFRASHQQHIVAPDVLCIRTDRISTRRRELILEHLVKEKKMVVNVGAEGVGTKM